MKHISSEVNLDDFELNHKHKADKPKHEDG